MTLKEAKGSLETPLRIVSHPRHYPLCSIADGRGRVIADVSGDSPDERENNTALFAHCVNTHAELVEALEAILEKTYLSKKDGSDTSFNINDLRSNAAIILSKASNINTQKGNS